MQNRVPMADCSPLRRGVRMILIAVFLMAAQDALIKWASPDLALSQMFVVRSILLLPVLSLIAGSRNAAAWRGALGCWPLLRAGLLTAMYVLLYAVIPYLSLAALAAAFYTGPLFITILSALLLKEKVRVWGWFCIGVGFAGVVVLLQPGGDAFTPIVVVPVLSGFCYALAAVVARSKCREASPVSLAMALNIVLAAAGAVLVVTSLVLPDAGAPRFLTGAWSPMAIEQWAVLITLAAMMVGIGLCLAIAYQDAPPVTIASFDYSYLVFAGIFGFILFGEVPGGATLAGMAMIASAGLLSTRG